MSKLRNDGKKLEALVAFVEKTFNKDGCVVITNDKVYNDKGEQIAEFDAIITKPKGEGSFKWLIECRDRPSSGSAPASWIEQLIGRKERFKFDKVTAVSTTGFSPGARDRAEFGQIELREMKELSPEEFGDWLTVYYQHVLSQHFDLINAEVFVENPSEEVIFALNDALQKMQNGTSTGFFLPAHNKYVDANILLNNLLSTSSEIRNIPFSDVPVHVSINAEYINDADTVTLVTNLGTIRVIKIKFDIRLTFTQHNAPIWASEYRVHQHDKKISDVATAYYDLGDQEIKVQMHKPTSGEGESYIEATIISKK